MGGKTHLLFRFSVGWLFKLKLTKPDELSKLMSEEQYTEFLKTADH